MKSRKLMQLVAIVFAACFTQVASDVYAPSLSYIAGALSAPVDAVQWTMAIYMLGVALSQLVYGPVSEAAGRRRPMIAGLIIASFASLAAALSVNILQMLIARLFQGIGAGACAALWRSTFRDVFEGDELAKMSSYFSILITFIVPAAPAVGGYLQYYFSWHASFVFMAGYAFTALFVMMFCFRETQKHEFQQCFSLRNACKHYKRLLSSQVFLRMSFNSFLAYGGVFSSMAVLPVIWIEVLGMSPLNFGWFVGVGVGSAYAIGSFVNGRLVERYGAQALMRVATIFMSLNAIALLLGYFIGGVNIFWIALPLLGFYASTTLIFPNAFARAFTPFGDIAGYCGALYGFIQVSGAAITGGVVSYLPSHTQAPLGIVLIGLSLLAYINCSFRSVS